MPKDWLGNTIEVGSPVLYAISQGHFAKVVWGEVLEILPKSEYEHWEFRDFRLKVQPYFENTDLVAGWGAGRSSDYVYKPGGKTVFKRKLPTPIVVKNVEKVTVFPLSDEVRARAEKIINDKVEANNERLKKRNG